jgi:hypothetical protein
MAALAQESCPAQEWQQRQHWQRRAWWPSVPRSRTTAAGNALVPIAASTRSESMQRAQQLVANRGLAAGQRLPPDHSEQHSSAEPCCYSRRQLLANAAIVQLAQPAGVETGGASHNPVHFSDVLCGPRADRRHSLP